MKISLIAAVAENGVIGKDNDLPWRLPADMRFFKKTTKGHCLIYGRKVFESLGKALPHRTNVVITTNPYYQAGQGLVAHSFREALETARRYEQEEIFVCGGTRVYADALPLADRLYLTHVHAAVEGDTYFPAVNMAEWREVQRDYHAADEQHAYAFTFATYERADGLDASGLTQRDEVKA